MFEVGFVSNSSVEMSNYELGHIMNSAHDPLEMITRIECCENDFNTVTGRFCVDAVKYPYVFDHFVRSNAEKTLVFSVNKNLFSLIHSFDHFFSTLL